MEKRIRLSLLEVLVGSCVLVFTVVLILLLLFGTRKALGPGSRVVCATNLKGLGTAMAVYSQDYDGKYPKLGYGPWSKELGYSYEDDSFRFRPSRSLALSYAGPCTITSSLYLLVREADVSPKSFVCTETRPDYSGVRPRKYSVFDGQNSMNLDIVELWDFGPEPHKYVSYAYHNPYGKYPAGDWLPASFATMADMSPWFSNGNIQLQQTGETAPQVIELTNPATWKYGLSLNHKLKKKSYSEGHNVVFADGHASYEKQPNIGVNNDNIFTYWSTEENPSEQDIQGGTAPTNRGPENDAKSKEDSFLAI